MAVEKGLTSRKGDRKLYDKSDPRAALKQSGVSFISATGLIAEPQVGLFYEEGPQIDEPSERTWLHRGHNFVLAYSELKPGAVLERNGQVDEYALILSDPEHSAQISAGSETVEVPGYSIVFIPPGDSSITMPNGGKIVRLFSIESKDLAQQCGNATAYDEPRIHIPDFEPWPEPNDGWKIRSYSLKVEKEEGRFGRIFRCTTFMINYLEPQIGPRNPHKLSPHHHDDFEQCSLALKGAFEHYLRRHWTVDMDDWCDDVTISCKAPSATVIPPPLIHTSRGTAESNQLVDIFCPPRIDFSEKPGWVLNADDYPMPTTK